MRIELTVRGDRISRAKNNDFIEGNKGFYEAVFNFVEDEWIAAVKECIVTCEGKTYAIPIIADKCKLPVFDKGTAEMGVIGVCGDGGPTISTNMLKYGVEKGALAQEVNTEFKTAAEIWEIYLADMEKSRKAAEEAAKSVRELNAEAETLPEGSEVSVKKIEKEDGITLRFGIPKGERGPRGYKGEKGDIGPKGETGNKGDKGEAGKDGTNGVNGKDGVSTTHSWNGTVLTVTSASGTSSADLKGDKGDKGEQGKQGPQGEKGTQGEKGADGQDGYTPVKGTDYWTPEDKAEIKAYVEDAILGGAW